MFPGVDVLVWRLENVQKSWKKASVTAHKIEFSFYRYRKFVCSGLASGVTDFSKLRSDDSPERTLEPVWKKNACRKLTVYKNKGKSFSWAMESG